MVQLKRAYEHPSKTDGYRALIDRLWPRGLTKAQLPMDVWLKELAPSTDLRKKFGHDPQKWKSFQRGFKKELQNPVAREKIKFLTDIAKRKKLTLVYGARDEEHNNAVVIKNLIEKKMKRSTNPERAQRE